MRGACATRVLAPIDVVGFHARSVGKNKEMGKAIAPHCLPRHVVLYLRFTYSWVAHKQAQRDRKQRSAAFPGGQDRPTTPERPPSILRVPTAAWPVGGETHPNRENGLVEVRTYVRV